MLVHKITTGFVTQTFDTRLNKWVRQEFTASDDVTYETARQNDDGEFLDDAGQVADDPSDLLPSPEPYLGLEMVQPERPE